MCTQAERSLTRVEDLVASVRVWVAMEMLKEPSMHGKRVNCGESALLGNSGEVVNSLDLTPLTPLASLTSLGCFYFRDILSSQGKAATENLRILHGQL